jgi:integrase
MVRSSSGISEASATSYEIAFTYRGIRCRERIKIKPSPTNGKRIANFLASIHDAIDKNSFDYSVTFPNSTRRLLFLDRQGEALLLPTYLDNWLESKQKQLKASTFGNYLKVINQIIRQFPNKMLADIKRADIRIWLSKMTCSNKNLSNIQSVLRSALQDAVNDELIETNPLYGWSYKNNEIPKEFDDVNPFDAYEQDLILKQLTGQNYNMYVVFFWTGLRPSELVALNWDDIDWLKGTISITKVLTQASKVFEVPKTKAGKRKVKILSPALAALENQKQYTAFKNAEIFQNPNTLERWTGDQNIRKSVWRPALKRAGVQYRRPYQTRHSYASMMLTAGESIAWLAEQMGHSSWIMLQKIYARFIPDSIPDAGDKAVEMFQPKMLLKKLSNTP